MTYAYVTLHAHHICAILAYRCASTMEQVSNCKRACGQGRAYVFNIYVYLHNRTCACMRASTLARVSSLAFGNHAGLVKVRFIGWPRARAAELAEIQILRRFQPPYFPRLRGNPVNVASLISRFVCAREAMARERKTDKATSLGFRSRGMTEERWTVSED